MTGRFVLAIDQGTSNTKALLVAPDASIAASRSRPMAVSHPHPGWAEQSANDIWLSVSDLIAEVSATVRAIDIAALAISNQRETIVLWDAETGEPLAPAILWQCQRSSDRCHAIRDQGLSADIASRSGLSVDPMFPAAKIAWLLDELPDARQRATRGEIKCGTIDSWLVWKLTDGAVHATDYSNASRTQLFNLETLDWDPVLASYFDVPLEMLPSIYASDGGFGIILASAAGAAKGLPIQVVLGDSHAALVTHGLDRADCAKVTIGTGSSLMMGVPKRLASTHGLSSTIAWSRKDGAVQHALEGNITVSGQAAAFATRLLGLPDEAALTSLANEVDDSDGVVFVPALAGLGAPHWRTDARGTVLGMSLGTQPAHIARATFEAIALQICDVLEAMESDIGRHVETLSIDGGASRNRMLAQLLADLSSRTIMRPAIAEASALGVARLAALACGFADWPVAPATDQFEPQMPAANRDLIRARWRRSLKTVIGYAQDHSGRDGDPQKHPSEIGSILDFDKLNKQYN